MRKHLIYIIMAVAVAVSGISCGSKSQRQSDATEAVDTIPLLVTEIQKCSRLYTAEFKVHKIVTHDDEVRIKGKIMQHDYDFALPVGSRKIAIPIDATIKAYIDFSDFSERDIVRHGNSIELILPDPKVQITSTKVSHNEIKKYVALLRHNFSDAEMSDYEQQGRQAIADDIPQMGVTEMAKQSAARILVPFFTALGYEEKDITITFRKDFTSEEIKKMIDPTTVIQGK